MTGELVLYTNPMSRGRVARWMLEEVGQPYQTHVLDYVRGLKSAAYLAVNPMGKVPAVTHGDVVVTENAAICAYLADAFPQAGLAPAPGDPERGPYYRWLFFAAAPLEAAVTNRTLGVDIAPEQERMAGYGSYLRVMQTLESVLDGREHLAGGRFSAADLYLGAHRDWGMRFGTIEARPAFERFVAPLRQRPAYLRAAEIDDALAAAQQG